MLGNDRANEFWAARLYQAEELDCNASPEQRREFITQKYREGRYRLNHPAFSSQEELLKVCLTATTTTPRRHNNNNTTTTPRQQGDAATTARHHHNTNSLSRSV